MLLPLLDLPAPELSVLLLHLLLLSLLSLFLLVVICDLLVELLPLLDERLDSLIETLLDHGLLLDHLVLLGRVGLQQAERVHAQLGDARAQVLRDNARRLQLFDLGVA